LKLLHSLKRGWRPRLRFSVDRVHIHAPGGT
jgi:hypothetical protein